MFLRSFATDPQKPTATVEPTPPAPSAPAAKAEASEFTRMFQPMAPSESVPPTPPPPSPPVPAPAGGAPSDGGFTSAFIVPSSVSDQPPPQKVKGFSTPGASDSASAEGSFTRIFRPDLQPAYTRRRPANRLEKNQRAFPPSTASRPLRNEKRHFFRRSSPGKSLPEVRASRSSFGRCPPPMQSTRKKASTGQSPHQPHARIQNPLFFPDRRSPLTPYLQGEESLSYSTDWQPRHHPRLRRCYPCSTPPVSQPLRLHRQIHLASSPV